MTAIQVVSVVFVGILLLFLMAVVLIDQILEKPLSTGAMSVMRVLCSICGGFAGGLFIGNAFYKGETQAQGTAIAFGLTGGFVVFWLIYRGWSATLGSGFNTQVIEGTSFSDTIESFKKASGISITASGFTEEQLKLPLSSAPISARSIKRALQYLGHLNKDIPRYEVVSGGQNALRLEVKN